MKYAILVLVLVLVLCGILFNSSEVNRINLQIEDDFHGLIEVRATSSASLLFTGDVRIPSDGYLEVKEKSFTGQMKIRAERLNGTNLDVELIRNEEVGNAIAIWQLGSGVFVHYFFVGTKAEAVVFYKENQERLYRIPESRLRRNENGQFELITPEN